MMDTHSQKPKNELSHALPNTKSSSHPSLVMNEHQTGEYDGKVKITISSERFSQLKKMVEEAIRDHKVFTIKGKWLYYDLTIILFIYDLEIFYNFMV